jgi:capsular polysaccharide biosynthesis protein
MDAEILLRSCWRRRWRLLLGALCGAVVFVIGGSVLVPARYVASADISVAGAFPPSLVDSSSNQVYVRDPDRFVATQIEVLSSQAASSQVAKDLDLPVEQVSEAITVRQLAKSDVIRVVGTSTDARQSARIADRLAANYVETVRARTRAQYDDAIESLRAQKRSVDESIAEMQAQTGTSTEAQNGYRSLVAQQGRLAIDLQHLILASQVAPDTTRIVSQAMTNDQAVGLGPKSLAFYGAVLGLAIGLCVVAIGSRPGRSLESLPPSDTVAGVPALGTLQPVKASLRSGRAEVAAVGNLGVAGEVARIIQLKGPLKVMVMGSKRTARQVSASLGPSVRAILDRQPAGWYAAADGSGIEGDDPLTICRLSERRGGAPEPFALLAVDVHTVRPRDLEVVVAGLRTSGTDVVGLVEVG